MRLLYEHQSPYKLIRVYKVRGKFLLELEGRHEIHSEYDPNHILLRPVTGNYWNVLSLFGMLSLNIKKVLILGLGAGTCARQMLHYRPDLHVEGVELDPDIVRVGKKYFGLDVSKITVHNQDAIAFLQSCKKKYDYIIVDAFIHGNLGLQFTSSDFYTLVKKHLNANGVVGINYLDEKNMMRRIKQGVSLVFSSVRQVCIPGTHNYVVLASDQKYTLLDISCPDDDTKRLKNFIAPRMKFMK